MNPLTAVKGAAAYATAKATGDIAPRAEQERRLAVCRACPNLQVRVLPVVGGVGGFCGEPAEETATTCGCLVGRGPAAATRAEALPGLRPAGATEVASKRCPAGWWDRHQ